MKWTAGLISLLMALGLFGCATTEPGGGAQQGTMDRLSENRDQLAEVRGQLDRTMHSLDGLMNAPPGDIPEAQQQYANDVQALRKMTDELAQNEKTLRQQRIDYLTEWERTRLNVQSPQLKSAAEQRQREVSQSLGQVESSMRQTNQDLDPLVTQLEDIAQVTAKDPSAAGMDAVRQSGAVERTQQRAAATDSELQNAVAGFEQALVILAPQPGEAVTVVVELPSFSEADRNASGAIEQDEAGQISGLDFPSADSDRDGQLSPSEYEAARRPPGGNGAPGAPMR